MQSYSCKVKFINASIENYAHLDEQSVDIALCLWNVLGHVRNNKLPKAIENTYAALKDDGLLLLDVNNRYNIKQYGLRNIFKNIFFDLWPFQNSKGDFPLKMNGIKSIVHIFTKKEIQRILSKAGFRNVDYIYINYENGRIEKSQFTGQLLIIAKK